MIDVNFLLQLVVLLVVGGLIYYLITLLPLPEPIRTIIFVIMIIVLILILLNAVGGLTFFTLRR